MATDPICGMFVEERPDSLSLLRDRRTYYFCSTHCLTEFDQPERELARLRRRLAVAWPLALLLVVLAYGPPVPEGPAIALVLATIVQVYPGGPFYRSSLDAVRTRTWNMDVLIAVGTTVAYAYSVAATLHVPGLPPETFFEASALIIALMLTGNYLEHRTRENARGALRALGEAVPARAARLHDGAEVEVLVTALEPGDRVVVRPGGRFPADGLVEEGHTSVNEALLTGESFPVPKGPGDPVIAGSVNGDGRLVVEVTRTGADTFLGQVGALVAEAETSRVPLQRLADRLAAVFVPLVLVLAIATLAGWLVAGVGVTIAILAFVSVVITACPCAFGLATPAALVVGTGRAAEDGILFKGRDSLEQASRIEVVVCDKTGTLTVGRPVLTDLVPAPGRTEAEVLSLAAGLESGSEHPIARAILDGAALRSIEAAPVTAIRAEPGRGVHGTLGVTAVSVRTLDEGADLGGPLSAEAARLEREGKGRSVVFRDGQALGLLGFRDALAPGALAAIQALRADGVHVVMATGDHAAAARAVAVPLGIEDVRAGLSPAEKRRLVGTLRASGRRVAFVGDGINDAPAMAAADLGIAIGSGTDVAREAGGVILVRSDVRDVALALRVGRRTVRKVRGNLAWAIGYNAVLIPIAMGALVPVFGLGIFAVLPITGAIAMALSSTSVVLNSLSLRWVSLGGGPPTASPA